MDSVHCGDQAPRCFRHYDQQPCRILRHVCHGDHGRDWHHLDDGDQRHAYWRALAGGRAARLVLGIVPMLIIAGIIEGFVSPSGIATPLKFLLAAVLFAALATYLARTGTPQPETT